VDAVLGFADVVASGLLYDKGADGVKDGPDRLATDLNAALESAGLGQAIIVQGTGTQLIFQIIDPTIDFFKIEEGTDDAGGFAQLGFAANTDTFETEHEATPTGGILADDAKLLFTLQRGMDEEPVLVTLTADATTNNVPVPDVHSGIGDDTIKLLRADNSATFDTAQSLAFRLGVMLAGLAPSCRGPSSMRNSPSTSIWTWAPWAASRAIPRSRCMPRRGSIPSSRSAFIWAIPFPAHDPI
jgi:hypothetical protein